MRNGVVQRRIAIVIGQISNTLQEFHAQRFNVVHVIFHRVRIGIFSAWNLAFNIRKIGKNYGLEVRWLCG